MPHTSEGNPHHLLTRELDPHLPVVVLTAHGSIELAVEAMQRGADRFLTKPVKPEALAVILERCLADGQQRRRRRAYDTQRMKSAG